MREIIDLHVGQCGIQIGQKFWQEMINQHKINQQGALIHTSSIDRLNIFFDQSYAGQYIPRATFIDLEPANIDSVKSGPLGRLFSPDNFISSKFSSGNNWAKGFYTQGAQQIYTVLQNIRKEIQKCEKFQGFQMTHSLGGGTGSGLGTHIFQKLKQEFPDQIFTNFSVFPSPKAANIAVQPYNSVLAMHQLLENSDLVFVFDNEALFNISSRLIKRQSATFGDLNGLIARAMMQTSSSIRFPGVLNADLKKLSANLILFPRLHFLITSCAPFTPLGVKKIPIFSVQQLTSQIFSTGNLMCSCDSKNGLYLSSAAIYRGRFSTLQIQQEIFNIQNKSSLQFIQWLPNHIKTVLCEVPPQEISTSSALISNSTSITSIFRHLFSHFNILFRRKTYTHWYTAEGMDQMEFTEAQSNLNDIISQYQQYQNTEINPGDDEDEEELQLIDY